MAEETQADQLAAQAAEAVRRVIAQAEARAAEIVREAESQAAKIRETAEGDAAQARERAEADARAQIEAAKRALDELGGTLAAAASAAIPSPTGSSETPAPAPAQDLTEPVPEETGPTAGNDGDAAERLVAMKLAVEGKDPAAIEAELIERFGPGDRADLLREVLSRIAR
jgi:colicin import membrane protein